MSNNTNLVEQDKRLANFKSLGHHLCRYRNFTALRTASIGLGYASVLGGFSALSVTIQHFCELGVIPSLSDLVIPCIYVGGAWALFETSYRLTEFFRLGKLKHGDAIKAAFHEVGRRIGEKEKPASDQGIESGEVFLKDNLLQYNHSVHNSTKLALLAVVVAPFALAAGLLVLSGGAAPSTIPIAGIFGAAAAFAVKKSHESTIERRVLEKAIGTLCEKRWAEAKKLGVKNEFSLS